MGGGCHWCTEAIFLSLKGVHEVLQGWIASADDHSGFSEAVIVVFEPTIISLKTLIAVHLATHSCTSNHAMRSKYRSAIYTFDEDQATAAMFAITSLQADYSSPVITRVMPFETFRLNTDSFLNYYYTNVNKPFCENVINPKLKALMHLFSEEADHDKLKHLHVTPSSNF